MQPMGKVTEILGAKAKVEMIRHSACSSCRACPMGHEESSVLILEADNPIHARPGQDVTIEFDPRTSIRAAALTYIWPLIAMFLGYAVLNWIFAARMPEQAEAISAIGSLAFSVAAFLSLRLLEPKLRTNRKFIPVIKEIIG